MLSHEIRHVQQTYVAARAETVAVAVINGAKSSLLYGEKECVNSPLPLEANKSAFETKAVAAASTARGDCMTLLSSGRDTHSLLLQHCFRKVCRKPILPASTGSTLLHGDQSLG